MFISNKNKNKTLTKTKIRYMMILQTKNKQYLPTTYNCIKSEIRRKK
ncbi:hypothetical protein SAG0347_09485 [Streptococcus agalactiae GB00891]|nr:hypothetical protein SAG0091_09620 [Streptococcus agalactiae LMG 15095]EPV41527.1 hypothetical protein SAG0347_09485 [Streptococcus agalactiae GB00891]KXA57301.1 hypothetical protein HMPREF1884_00004 [Streptococcus agalactiae]